MNFDTPINRVGTHSAKWDALGSLYELDPNEAISMWVADMDFKPPQPVIDAVTKLRDHGVFGYYFDTSKCCAEICSWMDRRHQWQVEPEQIFFTHGLVNAVGSCLQAYTKPGDGVVLFTPVYHAFSRVIHAADRRVISCQLGLEEGRYVMDFESYEEQMDGSAKMLILCSPHNPGGRVWTTEELRALADFADRHDLLIVSDEIHHDLTFGAKHIAFPNAAPEAKARTVMLTAPSKTFNIAGSHTGNVIIPDPTLRQKFAKTQMALGVSPNSFGIEMIAAAYKHGDEWVDALCAYLDENRRIFDAGLAEIPGLRSMPLEATYLAWVDMAGLGMPLDEVRKRVVKEARIAPNFGETFGKGGESFLRFNFGTTRANVKEAVARLQTVFADIQ